MNSAWAAAGMRAHYPSLRRRIQGKLPIYLDNACTALKPRCVARDISDFYRHLGGCGGKRSAHLFSQQVEALVAEARQETAAFIGAESANEIVFLSGTTEAANLLARAFPYTRSRREVVLTDLEHNGVLLPFSEAAARGEVALRICPTRNGCLDLDELERLVTRRTALVAVTRSSNVFGGVLPVAEAARIAHSRGACILVDDAQYLSSHRAAVRSADMDFSIFSAHKLGGPFGVGVLYGKEPLLNRLGVYKAGGGMVRSVRRQGDAVRADYLDAPARFEAGVQNLGGIIGWRSAIRFLRGFPAAGMRRHVADLVERAVAGLAGCREIEILGDPARLPEGAIVSFRPTHKRFSPVDFNLYLNHELQDRFIAIRIGEHCAHLAHQGLGIPASLRLSFFPYNLPSEVDMFCSALDAYLNEACRA